MADVLGEVFNPAMFRAAATWFFDMAFWIVVMAVIAGALFFFNFLGKFKHKVRIKEVVNGRKIIFDDRAREVQIDGINFWQLLKKKTNIPIPPAEAIEINHMGKKCVEVYKTETGDYIFAADRAEIKKIPDNILAYKDTKKREAAVEKWRDENKVIDTFHPLTTQQRAILVGQVRKAQEKKTKKWQDYIMPIAGITALVVLVIALMVFYEDMGKPLLSMADRQNSFEQIRLEELNIIKEIKYDIQIIREEVSKEKKPEEAPH